MDKANEVLQHHHSIGCNRLQVVIKRHQLERGELDWMGGLPRRGRGGGRSGRVHEDTLEGKVAQVILVLKMKLIHIYTCTVHVPDVFQSQLQVKQACISVSLLVL